MRSMTAAAKTSDVVLARPVTKSSAIFRSSDGMSTTLGPASVSVVDIAAASAVPGQHLTSSSNRHGAYCCKCGHVKAASQAVFLRNTTVVRCEISLST